MPNYNEQLNLLSDKEREIALKILSELQTDGKSKLYDDIKYAEYKEIPVDIITFIKDDRYLGKAWHLPDGRCKLFPYWEKRLKELFPDNITTAYNNAILTGARGLGKSEIAVTCILYMMYRLMCLKNPYQTLNLKPTEQVAFVFMNITKILAEDIGMVKFQNTVKSSPWFLERGTLSKSDPPTWKPPEFINIIIGSQPSHTIGQAIYAAFFDEISFIRTQDIEKQKQIAMDMIDTAVGGMSTRFIHNGKNPTMLLLASSKRSEKSFLETYLKHKVESSQGSMFIVDEATWNIHPADDYCGKRFNVAVGNKFLTNEIIPDSDTDLQSWINRGYKVISVPIEFRDKFLDDVDRALCDYAGISSSDLTKYISGPRLQAIKTSKYQNLFTKEIIEVGNGKDDTAQYYDFIDLSRLDRSMLYKPMYIHLDMSISGDKTGIAGVWIDGKKPHQEGVPDSKELFFRPAFNVSIKAPKGYQISFEKNRQLIYWLKEKGFNIKGISSDTFQSADLAQQLSSKGYNYKIISVDRINNESHICEPYHYFKNAIYEERIALYEKCDLLTEEILGLERNSSGKIDHPDGGRSGCFTGDTLVSLCDGRKLSFVQLVDEYNSGKINYVYSFNEDKKIIEPKKIKKAWMTRQNAELVEVILDNGQILRCTPDHRFMLRDGSYSRADQLQPQQSLMPLYIKHPSKGLLQNYRMYYEPIEDAWHFEHRRFAEQVYDEKRLVHHVDCNPQNNNPDNLIWMSKAAHVQLHAQMKTGAQSDEANNKRKESLKRYYLENKESEEYLERNKKYHRH